MRRRKHGLAGFSPARCHVGVTSAGPTPGPLGMAAGEAIITKPEWDDPSVGRFARVHDPEGNPIELWEPAQAG